MVYKGGYVRTPTSDMHDGPSDDKQAKKKAHNQDRWCQKFFGILTGYILMVCILILNVPHDIEWDFSHILWPVAPCVIVCSGGFFAMIYYLFWDDFKERLERKDQ
mmetsp:Transcript_24650/g.62238  ORF Transcript_24650/g.62238 Transcript_24650/m.62238 type:complete len:105 (-) Transcript_24650:46-360(-)